MKDFVWVEGGSAVMGDKDEGGFEPDH